MCWRASPSQMAPAGPRCRELMLAMAVNHSVLLETVNGQQELSASSPDEQAFVAAAEYFGFEYVARDADRGVLTLLEKQSGIRHEVEVLEVRALCQGPQIAHIVAAEPDVLVHVDAADELARLGARLGEHEVVEGGVARRIARSYEFARLQHIFEQTKNWRGPKSKIEMAFRALEAAVFVPSALHLDWSAPLFFRQEPMPYSNIPLILKTIHYSCSSLKTTHHP